MTPREPVPLQFETLPPLLQWLFLWLEKQPILAALLCLMVMDIFCGILLSIVKKTLSSAISWRGMSKKSMVLIMVGLGSVLEPFTQGIPLSRLVGIFYICTEALSILENAAAAGVPLPAVLVDMLAKLKDSQRTARAQKDGLGIPSVNVAVVVPDSIRRDRERPEKEDPKPAKE